MSPLEQLADQLRRKDVELRGGNPASLLAFDQLNTPEQTRWLALAAVALPRTTAIRDTLAWYADEHRYHGHDPAVLADTGALAREALGLLPA